MRTLRKGYHTVAGHTVYTLGGEIWRVIRRDEDGHQLPAGIYERQADGTLKHAAPITVEAFRDGMKTGSLVIRSKAMYC